MTKEWAGRWRIVETDLWGDESIDLLEPAYLELGANRLGALVVGALQAGIDYRVGERDGRPTVEFSWLGDDDGHPASGWGWCQLAVDRTLRVRLFIHQGDDVTMTGHAVGAPPPPPPRASARRGPASRRRR